MKEATGEVSMTVITLVAIAIIGAILALMWPKIQERINGMWTSTDKNAEAGCKKIGGTWNSQTGECIGGTTTQG